MSKDADARIFQKEVVLRIYGAELQALKQVLQQVSALPGLSVSLFGKDNEYLVRLLVTSGGEAASNQLCESAAQMIEDALGEDVYGRGDHTLAHYAAAALLIKSATLATVSPELGELLATEFSTTKRGERVFDFGAKTYQVHGNFAPKAKTIQQFGASSIQAATELAFAAMKKGRAKYGAALSQPDGTGRRWAVVTEKNRAFVRQLPPDASGHAAALAILDLVRRILAKGDIPQGDACYRKGHVNPAKPLKNPRGRGKLLAICAVCVLLLLTGAACLYFSGIYAPFSAEAIQAFAKWG